MSRQSSLYGPSHHESQCFIFSLAYSPDGKYLATGCSDELARLWDVQTGQLVQTIRGTPHHLDPEIFARQQDPDHGQPRWYRPPVGRPERKTVHILSAHATDVQSVAFSPDGKYVLTGSADQTARLWDAQTGAYPAPFSGHIGTLGGGFSPDG